MKRSDLTPRDLDRLAAWARHEKFIDQLGDRRVELRVCGGCQRSWTAATSAQQSVRCPDCRSSSLGAAPVDEVSLDQLQGAEVS